MPLKIRNLDYLRNADRPRLEAVTGRVCMKPCRISICRLESSEPDEQQPDWGTATARFAAWHTGYSRDGYMHVALNDQGPLYRGVKYWVEHADNPNFTNAVHTQASGTELRNHTEFIGNQTRYVQAISPMLRVVPLGQSYMVD